MTIKTTKDAVKIALKLVTDWKKEHCIAIHLDASGGLLRAEIVSIGILTMNLVHPRELFRSAIVSSAATTIMMHNHPSGSLVPSGLDIKTAKRMAKCGELLQIPLVDSVIFNEFGKFYSLRHQKKM